MECHPSSHRQGTTDEQDPFCRQSLDDRPTLVNEAVFADGSFEEVVAALVEPGDKTCRLIAATRPRLRSVRR
jgi:hypothetical protein